jgi:protein TonB
MSVRLAIAFALSWVVTTGLFWTLRVMIGVEAEVGGLQVLPKIEFLRLRRDSSLEEKKRVKPEISKPEPQPSTVAAVAASKASVDPGSDLAVLAPSVDFSGSGGSLGFEGGLAAAGGSDRGCVPQVRIEPDYPMRARQRKIEGYVDVQFTVASHGGVKDPIVIGANPPGIFENAALQAVSHWKYSPKREDGRPAECVGTRVRIAFRLRD